MVDSLLLTGLACLAGAAVCGAVAVAVGLRAAWGYLAPSLAPAARPSASWAALRPTTPPGEVYALVCTPGRLYRECGGVPSRPADADADAPALEVEWAPESEAPTWRPARGQP